MTKEDTKHVDEDKVTFHRELHEKQVKGGQFEPGPKAKYKTRVEVERKRDVNSCFVPKVWPEELYSLQAFEAASGEQ